MKIDEIVGLGFTWLLRLFLFVTGIIYLIYGDPVGFTIYMFMFILSLLPVMLGQLYKITFHWLAQLILAFLFAVHMFGFLGAYLWFPFYDDLAHILGSAMLAFIGFAIIYAMNYAGKIRVNLSMMGIFTFIWTMAIGAVWEIMEFIWDNIVILSHEYGFAQNSLFDTMSDLSLDATAGVCVALFCIFLIKRIEKKHIKGFFEPFAKIVQRK
ncbi:MAG: hypothetical protein KKA65_02835 [Nanoarchaeota archaeon]|nr:hypothetical protein [Nanoarchaeota archaeon]MBU4242171.1 hypothetical protein [Nanoarchaeota archaeon]MBU4352550.1 hypothetical protein [Nanoarchaeota archaeon]MBU4456413.1 hypothetical protein [Nanoarchaeota archaeon]MCG2720192.1 hypothetical protein [Nanoarchaeota archaeon]